jgi:hypothetical protein
MKTILKHFIKPISAFITLAGCLFLGAIAFVLINPNAITKLAQDSIQKTLLQHTEGNITFDTLQWSLFPFRIKAHQLNIKQATPDKPLIFALESVQLKPDIWRFLLGDYSGTLHIQINHALSLQADSSWSSENQQLVLNNAIFQYTMPNKNPIILHGNFYINPLNHTLKGTLKGPKLQEATLDIHLQSAHADSKTTGHIKLSVQEGNIPGIALAPLLEHVQASVQSFIKLPFKQQLIDAHLILDSELTVWKTQANTHQVLLTPFTVLEATATLDKGILTNQDLKLTQGSLTISGQGTLNLIDGSLDYHALAWLNANQEKQNPEEKQFFSQTPLRITLTGNLQSPAIHPELTAYFQSAIKQLSPQVPEKNTRAEESISTFENLFETQH